jgi:hypothetical protein
VQNKIYLRSKTRRKLGIYAGTLVYEDQISYYLDDTFYSALEAWWFTKKFKGPPHGEGWANENVWFLSAYAAIESENDAIQKEELDAKRNEATKPTEMKKKSDWTSKQGNK